MILEKQILLEKAQAFLAIFYEEYGQRIEKNRRIQKIKEDIFSFGTYALTEEELTYGAKLAWRNSTRCIGRLYWKSLIVRDFRNVFGVKNIEKAILKHIEIGTNDGAIKPLITIFSKEDKYRFHILNDQLIRYAGHRLSNGKTLGDPLQVDFTNFCKSLGWKPKMTPFDVLPIVLRLADKSLYWFEIPDELILEVPIQHPDYQWFSGLGLKWYSTPIISNMDLEIGGLVFPAAPFNGWYMGTEIGARNLADEDRYNVLPEIGKKMGLNINKNASLWKDKALVELNYAVLYSYQQKGVQIVDHHTASDHYMKFMEQETSKGRCPFGDWSWIVPPISGAATKVFHQNMKNKEVSPNFFNRKPIDFLINTNQLRQVVTSNLFDN